MSLTQPLCLLIAAALLSAPDAHAFDAKACPRFLPARQHATSAPGPSGQPTAGIAFHGLLIPTAPTDFPMIDAGLALLARSHSEQFLVDALNLLCRAGEARVDCDAPVASGDGKGDAAGDVYDVWQTGATAPAASAELAACREYARISSGLSEALLPSGVALLSNPYSNEGMAIRRSFWRALQIRPSAEARARAVGADLTALDQLLDDIRFAELLADKLSSDGKIDLAAYLLDEIKRSAADIELASAADSTLDRFVTLLSTDWSRLREAIQKAL